MSNQRSTPLLLALLLASLSLSRADLYGNPSPPFAFPGPPPPFAVAGKQFPPQTGFCLNPNSPCFKKNVTCPAECPQFHPAASNAKGCLINCFNPTCEGICRNRKPDCEGNGAACYDPRFIGGDGVMFYFHGKSNHHFALVSDDHLHINAHFIGLRPAGRPRDFTWIQALGIMFGPHTFTLAATKSSVWDPSTDHFTFASDDNTVILDDGHRSSLSLPNGLTVERTATVNSVTVKLSNVFEITAAVVPITKEDDRIHRYGIPANDCFAHLEVQFRFLGLSERVEGVLGQTYRPDFQSPVKRGVAMPIMGGEDRYATDSLLSSSCKRCVFSPEARVPAVEVAGGSMDCSSKMGNGYAVVCKR